ncbi:MAG: type VI secretion system-associated protein TagF [Pseudomonadota bacterium]
MAQPPGFFGKLPIRGDFVSRRMDTKARAVLDDWLSDCIVTSNRALGERWAEAYAHAPAWRFILTAGVAGSAPLAGIMVPSADHYGRRFPLVIVVEIPNCPQPFGLVRTAGAWFSAAERAAQSGLMGGNSLEVFDSRVEALGQPVFASDSTAAARHFAFHDETSLTRAYSGVLEAALDQQPINATLWWTSGSGGIAPSLLYHKGLPAADRFAAFLDGGWEAWGWNLEPVAAEPVSTSSVATGSALRSAARMHHRNGAGHRDALLERPDLGLWVIADGRGDDDLGHFASELVIAKLSTFQAALSFGSALTELEELLSEANDMLNTHARQMGPDRICAVVIVALFVHKGQYAVIWAGDCRAYLQREGRLQRLTRDHTSDGNRYVTRAIGTERALALDVVRGEVQPGDRFVLCNDGLTLSIADQTLEAAVRRGSAADAVSGLIDDALIAGNGANVSALVVDVVA